MNNRQQVVFENDNYKLVLSVIDGFDSYQQHCFSALLKLYTKDNSLLTTDVYIFPLLVDKFDKDIEKAFTFYKNHLESRNNLLNLSYDLYLKSLRELCENNGINH